MPLTATLPRLPSELWQRIDMALTSLDVCMRAAPCRVERIEADAAYVERLAVALKEVGAAIQAARLRNDVADPRSWQTESQAESWARALLQRGFDEALTSEALAAWLGQTNGEGKRPGGDPAFFGLMQSSLSDFARALRETTCPQQGPVPYDPEPRLAGTPRTPEQPTPERLRDAIQELLFYSTYRDYEKAAGHASSALQAIRAADIAPPGHAKDAWLHQFKVDAFKLYCHITAGELPLDQLQRLHAAMKERQDELWAVRSAPPNAQHEPQAVAEESRPPTVGTALEAQPSAPTRTLVFFCYSHKDKTWLSKFQTMLKPLMPPEMLWDDTKIKPGTKWKEAIARALASAKAAVLLVSPDFLASDFIEKHELPPLLNAAKHEGLTILWVPVRPSPYEQTEIATYQAAHDPAHPLYSLQGAKREQAIVDICKTIRATAQTPVSPNPQ
jgi:hypothetical protein